MMAEKVTKTTNLFNWTAGVCWNEMTKMSNKYKCKQTKLVNIDKSDEYKKRYICRSRGHISYSKYSMTFT